MFAGKLFFSCIFLAVVVAKTQKFEIFFVFLMCGTAGSRSMAFP
jgi:hypothetical protein